MFSRHSVKSDTQDVSTLNALKELGTQFNEGLFLILFRMFVFDKGDKSLVRFNDY
jgi:hypothetical protein